MLSGGEKIFMALASGEFLLGFVVNGFIALVNCIDRVKRKKLPPSDLILVSLAISRIGLSCTIVWESYLIVTSINVPTQVRMIDIFLVLTHGTHMWFATVLSIFYFLKITNFSNPFFLWMKRRIDRMLFMLLMRPFIIYFSIAFPMMQTMYFYHSGLFSRGKERNVSEEVHVSNSIFFMLQVLFSVLSLIPFILSITSFSLFILSLWKHIRQMQLNATGQRDPSTEAHVGAMKAVSSFIILFLLYYVGFYVNYLTKEKSKLASMLCVSIMLFYSFGHSVILILSNSKLRKAALRVSWLMRFCQRGCHLQALWVPLRIIWHFLGRKKSHWSP
ncbi:taste receptor type 2 member 7-like [Phascolarctos cinereus]|uniref:Taste receptor type 2 n=1 Tax=Phascolarctos cinereus TaxID=38626 RepID=A0A6P5J9I7_PHACI|nr:taste receptor type 2 member 7-like [Phascolarctos cinereus]